MQITGYSDRLSAAPGETIEFKISCEAVSYRADLVRLIHGDPNPAGPGFKETVIESAIDGDHPGRTQNIHTGSFVLIEDAPKLNPPCSFSICAWIMPTLPGSERQAIVAKWNPHTREGYALELDEAGALSFSIGEATVDSGAPLNRGIWYFVAASADAVAGTVTLFQRPLTVWPLDPSNAASVQDVVIGRPAASRTPLLIGARSWTIDQGPDRCFNGKIDSPAIFGHALTIDEIECAMSGGASGLDTIAAWDFSKEMSSACVVDGGPHGFHGRAVNLPTRAVTGRRWTGNELNHAHAPDEYSAIHFHNDDLDDANWETDFTFVAPPDLPSGVYAVRLRAGDCEDHLPFVVRPPRGVARSKIAYLVSTYTYLAYANEHMPIEPVELYPFLDPDAHAEEYAFIDRMKLNSLYDTHADGSGVCYASWRRPMVNTRPKAYFRVYSSPERLGTDLYLTDWLDAKGCEADVIADENIHDEGAALLQNYRVLVTGSHPEYWTAPMMDALETYIAGGGRVMYLGGNGFYWVTAVDPTRPHVIEIRRTNGTATWDADPGETFLSTTGEQGGLWRHRNRAPQRLLGVGFTAQGNDYSRPYDRQPDSFDPRAAFIFEGIGENEPVGDFPSLMLRHGAAGYEIDRADFSLGTPPHTLVVATATGFSDSYQHAIEEIISTDASQGGTTHPLVRADIVFFEGLNGGAVFSIGSIAWLGALSYNCYDNNVSRMTSNVLRRFASDEPFLEPTAGKLP